MILRSHVSLLIHCEVERDAVTISELLGVQPSAVREDKSWSSDDAGGLKERLNHTWTLDSPLSHTEADPTARLYALADIIEPFAAQLQGLGTRFKPFVDVVYHVTPTHPHGVMGEFDWFLMPAALMRRYAAWDLDVSYEAFWFDHPEWVRRRKRGWWGGILDSLRGGRTGAKEQ